MRFVVLASIFVRWCIVIPTSVFAFVPYCSFSCFRSAAAAAAVLYRWHQTEQQEAVQPIFPLSASSSDSASSSSASGNLPMNPDEYDVIVLYPKSEIPFFLQETPDGEAAFAGYVQYDQPCSTIKNVGDVLVAIDGEPVSGKTIRQIVQIVQEKARNCAYSFLRFRSTIDLLPATSTASSSSSSSATNPQISSGQLPGERRRGLLERKMAQLEQQVATKLAEIESLQEQRQQKMNDLDVLDQKDMEWIEQKRLELIDPNRRNFTALWTPSATDKNSNVNNNDKDNRYYAYQNSGKNNTSETNAKSGPQWRGGP